MGLGKRDGAREMDGIFMEGAFNGLVPCGSKGRVGLLA
jgi:hypothetical protein